MHNAWSRHFVFFNATATTEIYTLSLHDALPIWRGTRPSPAPDAPSPTSHLSRGARGQGPLTPSEPGEEQDHPKTNRSEEHTSELQSRLHLVCRLLLEKKKTTSYNHTTYPARDAH